MVDGSTQDGASRLPDWPMRPWVLAGMLGISGLIVNGAMDWGADNIPPWRAAIAAFFFFAPLLLAFTLEDDRWKAPLIFAGISGLVLAGIAWRVASAQGHYADPQFWLAAGVVSVGLALPLFQAGFHKLRWKTSYPDAFYHVWADAISAAGAFAFLGLSWLLLVLLSELFAAINITFLRELAQEEWFGWLFSGVAFGAALGILRNQLKIVGTLQTVVLLVLSLIAVPFAAALAIFLLAVVVNEIGVLWGATQSPTPLLLACAAASFVLVNAVVRNDDGDAAASPALQIAALVLALGILPLAIMAAVSSGTRIAQYGLSPERIWSLIAVTVAVVYGVAYFAAPIRGRWRGWMDRIRSANLHLAVGTCVFAFILALPLFDFGAISARDQIARLQSGKVSVEEFDFSALRWDFGDAGRRALATLTRSGNAEVAKLAKETQNQEHRFYGLDATDRQQIAERADITVADDRTTAALRSFFEQNPYKCSEACRAVEVGSHDGGQLIAISTGGDVEFVVYDPARNAIDEIEIRHGELQPLGGRDVQLIGKDSKVELRPYTGQQLYIDGKPASAPFR